MYNEPIKVANKIITDQNLMDIFYKMQEEMENDRKICRQEEIRNEACALEHQVWSLKKYDGSLKFNVNFYDDTSVKFDNFNNFIGVFQNRLPEIKNIWVLFRCSYWIQDGKSKQYVSQSISMNIYENKMSIDVQFSSADGRMEDIYEFIKNIILNTPLKYDRLIQKKNFIIQKVSFASGVIPSTVLLSLLLFFAPVRKIYAMTYILYPLAVVILGSMIGNMFLGARLANLYENIIPDKKYDGYDTHQHKRIYKDDIDKFVATSEILIGKNTYNLKNREKIQEMEEKYNSYILYEIIGIVVLSVFVIFIGKVI